MKNIRWQENGKTKYKSWQATLSVIECMVPWLPVCYLSAAVTKGRADSISTNTPEYPYGVGRRFYCSDETLRKLSCAPWGLMVMASGGGAIVVVMDYSQPSVGVALLLRFAAAGRR